MTRTPFKFLYRKDEGVPHLKGERKFRSFFKDLKELKRKKRRSIKFAGANNICKKNFARAKNVCKRKFTTANNICESKKNSKNKKYLQNLVEICKWMRENYLQIEKRRKLAKVKTKFLQQGEKIFAKTIKKFAKAQKIFAKGRKNICK